MTDWMPGEPAPCGVTDPHDAHIWGASASGYSLQCNGVAPLVTLHEYAAKRAERADETENRTVDLWAEQAENQVWQQVVRCWNTEPHEAHDDGTRYFCPGVTDD